MEEVLKKLSKVENPWNTVTFFIQQNIFALIMTYCCNKIFIHTQKAN